MSAPDRAVELIKAACSHEVRHARVLLDAEPDLARFDAYTACACGEPEALRAMLARDPALANGKGGPNKWEPILYGCFSRFLRCDAGRAARIVEAVAELLRHGANPNAFYTLDSEGEIWRQTPLFGAAGIANNAELTRMLLDVHADVDEGTAEPDPVDPKKSPWGTEALYHASEFNDVECLTLLLNAKPHPIRVSYCLGRVLDFENHAGVLLYLQHGANPNFRIPWFENRTHLQKAVMRGRQPQTIEALIAHGGDINARDARNISVYRYAVRFGHAELARLLADHGADTSDLTDDDKRMAALWRGEAASLQNAPRIQIDPEMIALAARRDDTQSLIRLLDAGADIGASAGLPMLHQACWCGRLNATKILVERGADIHWANSYGGDALGAAIHGSANCFDIEGGPSMKLPEEAVKGEYDAIVEMLIHAGAKLPSRIWGGSDSVREILRKHGVPDARL